MRDTFCIDHNPSFAVAGHVITSQASGVYKVEGFRPEWPRGPIPGRVRYHCQTPGSRRCAACYQLWLVLRAETALKDRLAKRSCL
jgi:hypothetical protein